MVECIILESSLEELLELTRDYALERAGNFDRRPTPEVTALL
jgi:hypothetical protein